MNLKKSATPASSNRTAICYVRFSSAEQAAGDSERRQIETAQAYCKKHDLKLVQIIQDHGLSGYTGENQTKGKLTKLVDDLKSGVIAKGTTLIVESFDRLSRQDALAQLALFTELMMAGVNLVTLDNGMNQDRANASQPDHLLVSLMSMMRGHDESKLKSQRVTQAWENKLRNATLKPLTSLCPQWIKLEGKIDDATCKLVLISDRARVVKLIFRLAAEGMGKRTIARELNRRRIKTFGSDLWQDSYVHRILNNPAVLGFYQAYKQRKGEARSLNGEPIANYYPPAITQAMWDDAHQKPNLPTGPRSARVRNLFTGLLVDDETQSTFQLDLKNVKSANPWIYLRPRIYFLQPGERDYRIKYSWFEEVFFQFCAQADWVTIAKENAEDMVTGETEENQLSTQSADLEKRIRKLARLIESAPEGSLPTLMANLQGYESDYRAMMERLEAIRKEAAGLQQSVAALQSAPPLDERSDPAYRRSLQLEIRKRVKKITVFPHTHWDPVEKRLRPKTPGWTTFIIHFTNAAERILSAKNDDPTTVIVQEFRQEWDYTKSIAPKALKRKGVAGLKQAVVTDEAYVGSNGRLKRLLSEKH
jgi:DNA invertase Pin-like site-specific DNA recombinase